MTAGGIENGGRQRGMDVPGTVVEKDRPTSLFGPIARTKQGYHPPGRSVVGPTYTGLSVVEVPNGHNPVFCLVGELPPIAESMPSYTGSGTFVGVRKGRRTVVDPVSLEPVVPDFDEYSLPNAVDETGGTVLVLGTSENVRLGVDGSRDPEVQMFQIDVAKPVGTFDGPESAQALESELRQRAESLGVPARLAFSGAIPPNVGDDPTTWTFEHARARVRPGRETRDGSFAIEFNPTDVESLHSARKVLAYMTAYVTTSPDEAQLKATMIASLTERIQLEGTMPEQTLRHLEEQDVNALTPRDFEYAILTLNFFYSGKEGLEGEHREIVDFLLERIAEGEAHGTVPLPKVDVQGIDEVAGKIDEEVLKGNVAPESNATSAPPVAQEWGARRLEELRQEGYGGEDYESPGGDVFKAADAAAKFDTEEPLSARAARRSAAASPPRRTQNKAK